MTHENDREGLAHDSTIERLQRAMLSLEGLSCGDAFGENFFSMPLTESRRRIAERIPPAGRWAVTDDTLMAVSVVDILRVHGAIDAPALALHFAELYDPVRGYVRAMHELLAGFRCGNSEQWRDEAAALFNGQGSWGNGSAMRVAPLGAYFANDLDTLVSEAERSAITTHTHGEAVAGAIATALGAAMAWQSRADVSAQASGDFLEAVRDRTPPSQVRNGIEKALVLKKDTTPMMAGVALGNGADISAADTVPFVLWSAGRSLRDYETALWDTVSAGGDKDTTCAMVGGIVALSAGRESIPEEWLRRRESIAPFFAARYAR